MSAPMSAKSPDLVIPLSRLRAALARPRGLRRVHALLSADDPEAAVDAMSVPDLYFLVRDVGLADCVELLSLAEPEKIQGCMDFEVWERDRLQSDALLPWMCALAESGYDRLAQVWRGLDPELVSLYLAKNCTIYDRNLDEAAPEDEERAIYATPDTFFELVLTSESEETCKWTQQLIEDLYRADPELARHTIMSARSELPAQLEELAYRWRTGRLADHGYVDYYDALVVFQPLEPSEVTIGEGTAPLREEPSELPAPILDQVVGRAFLARAVEAMGPGPEAEALQSSLVTLVNRVLAAARIAPGDSDAVAVGAEHATASLALGLEHLSGADVERAAEALRTVALTRLHRVGYTLTLRLARFARLFAASAPVAGDDGRALLQALFGRRPFYPVQLDSEGGEGLRPFESVSDLKRCADALTELALRIALVRALGIDPAAAAEIPEPRPELDHYARTALARLAGGGEASAAPLTVAELSAFAARFQDDRRALISDLSDRLGQVLDAAEVTESRERVPALVSAWLEALEDELGGIDFSRDLDPAAVSLVLCAARAS